MDNISYFKNNNLLVIRRYNEDNKGQNGYIVVVPKKTPIILHSTYQLFNGSKKYTNYLLTI
ncbi:hypothetical protein V1477_008653 [Vespula maculifrons]|uniref:Uncharacterized protein n=1 Tax=Vespula maculifrons TaxID=7453 RepID=A0ABD2CE20_VESMC